VGGVTVLYGLTLGIFSHVRGSAIYEIGMEKFVQLSRGKIYIS
jgi:hypothetical protein